MIFYDIAGIRFANPYAAFLYGSVYQPHVFPKFNFFQEQFDKIDWTIEPVESFQQLCDQRALQLRDKYKKITLAFSGGTDSITMYNAFARNNIHIDQIYIANFNADSQDCMFNHEKAADWLIRNHHDKTTKILVESIHNQSRWKSFEHNLLSDDYLIKSDVASMHRYHPQPMDTFVLNNVIDDDHCIIAGYEKPRLIQDSTGYYFQFVDVLFRTVMMRPDLEFFFITPDMPQLHSKQCHMLLRTSQQLNIPVTDLDKLSNYYIKCTGSGRDQEVHDQSSQREKVVIDQYLKIMHGIDFSNSNSDNIRSSIGHNKLTNAMTFGIEQGRQAMKKFIGNWSALQTDSSMINYLVRHRILDSKYHPIQSYHGICSKPYKIKHTHV